MGGDDDFLPGKRVVNRGEEVCHALADAGTRLRDAVFFGIKGLLYRQGGLDLLRPEFITRHVFRDKPVRAENLF